MNKILLYVLLMYFILFKHVLIKFIFLFKGVVIPYDLKKRRYHDVLTLWSRDSKLLLSNLSGFLRDEFVSEITWRTEIDNIKYWTLKDNVFDWFDWCLTKYFCFKDVRNISPRKIKTNEFVPWKPTFTPAFSCHLFSLLFK